ncbi:MAG: hypothetical protein M1600_01650 [Firmicutes bacterium]|nr:hypothetical protein [Bacillota bacterium]
MYTRAYPLVRSRVARSRRLRRRWPVFVSWSWWAAGLLAISAAVVISTPLGTAPADSQNQLFFDNFSTGTLDPFTVYSGDWQLTSHGLTANNLLSTHLDRQFLYMPYAQPDAWLSTVVTINQVPKDPDWRVGLFVHGLGGDSPDKWSLVILHNQISLLNENTAWVASAPFHARLGVHYHMELLSNGLVVDGMVWPQGSPPPKQWTLSAQFAPNQVAEATNVGLYAGNIDATFSQFTLLAPPPPLSITPSQAAGVFMKGNPLAYAISVQNPSVRPRSVVVRYTLHGVTTPVIRQGHLRIDLNGSRPVSHRLFLPHIPNGLYRIRWSLANTSPPNTVTTRLPDQALAVVPQPLSSSTGTTSGLNENLAGLGQVGSLALLKEHFTLMREQGITRYRLQLPLPAPGQSFDWSKYRRIITAAESSHLQVLGLITGPSPSKAHPWHALKPRYLAFVRALVRHYQPRPTASQGAKQAPPGIVDWEIWNEPSTRYYWGLSAAKYGHLLSQAVAAIHFIDPSAFVLGYAYDLSQEWPAVRHKPNGWTFHYYPGVQGPNNPEYSLTQAVHNLRTFLQIHHDSAPIWITEVGWSTKQVSPAAQAQDLVQARIDAAASGVGAVFYFTQTYYGGGYGEESPNLAPLPAYAALGAVDRTLEGLQAEDSAPNLGPMVDDAAFRGHGGRTVLAIWSSTPTAITLPSQPGIEIYSAMDNPIPVKDNLLHFTINAWPTYVVAHDWSMSSLSLWLNSSPLSAIAPYRLSVRHFELAGPSGANLSVTAENLSNQTETGYLRITLPTGWSTPDPISSLSTLAPGQTIAITIPLQRTGTRMSHHLALNLQAFASGNRTANLNQILDVPRTVAPKSPFGHENLREVPS